MKQDYYGCIVSTAMLVISVVFIIIYPDNGIATGIFTGSVLAIILTVVTYTANFKKIRGQVSETMIKYKENLSKLDILVTTAYSELEYLQQSKSKIASIVCEVEEYKKDTGKDNLLPLWLELHNLQPRDTIQRYSKEIHHLLSENSILSSNLTGYLMDLGQRKRVLNGYETFNNNVRRINRHLYGRLVHLKADTNSVTAVELTIENLKIDLDYSIEIGEGSIDLNLSDVLSHYYMVFQVNLRPNPFLKLSRCNLRTLAESILETKGPEFMKHTYTYNITLANIVENKFLCMGLKDKV